MTNLIPEKYLDLLEEAVVVGFATIMPDGQPQVTPVWCLWDGENILINTAVGRQKEENVRRNKKVTVLAVDPQNPYRYLEVRGTVTEMQTEGAEDVIDRLARLYTDNEKYYGGVAPEDSREDRVTFVIQPTDSSYQG